jgi:hypothetical protein
MCKAVVIAVLAAAGAAMVSGPPARAQQGQYCFPGEGCAPSTPQRYNACFELALQRGLTVSRGDGRNLHKFLYDCLRGAVRQ